MSGTPGSAPCHEACNRRAFGAAAKHNGHGNIDDNQRRYDTIRRTQPHTMNTQDNPSARANVDLHVAPERRTDSLITYPSQFPIKVMGLKVDGLVQAMTQVAHQFDPTFDASTLELRESKGGKYIGITLPITATSREQLDALYRALSTHPMVKVVL